METMTEPDVPPGDPPVDAFTTVCVAGVAVNADTIASQVHNGDLELDGLSSRERDVVFQLCEIARRRAEAAVTLVVDSADRTGSYAADGHASVRGWSKALCRWSNHDARTQTALMRLIRDHPRTAGEFVAGRLGRSQAVLLAELAQHRRAGRHYPDSEDLLVEDAQMLDYEALKTVANRWLTLADPDGADQDEQRKHDRRNGCVIRDSDGVVHLDARFAGAQGAAIRAIFDRFYQAETEADFDAARAERTASGDDTTVRKGHLPRSDEQRRADALYAVFTRAASTPPDAKPLEPVVDILVDMDTFERLIARCGSGGDGEQGEGIDPASYRQRRCETASGEPVAPVDVLAAALVGQVRRVVIESPSTVIDLGRRQRLFTGSARAAARLRHPRCTYPGCGLIAELCQIDHITSWQQGGPTASRNGQPNCPRHNRWKQQGHRTWQDRNGHWHTIRPDGTRIQAI